MTRVIPSFRLTASRSKIQRRAALLFFSASCGSSPFKSSFSSFESVERLAAALKQGATALGEFHANRAA